MGARRFLRESPDPWLGFLAIEGQRTLPLPEDPALAAIADALNATGSSAEVLDRESQYVFMTDDLRLQYGGLLELAPVPIGKHYFGPEALATRLRWRGGPNTIELGREVFAATGGWILADTTGGSEAFHGLVDTAFRDLVDGLPSVDPVDAWSFTGRSTFYKGTVVDYGVIAFRVRATTPLFFCSCGLDRLLIANPRAR